MNDMIEIQQTQINGAEENSVNSREIYEYLEVDTQYSIWIQRAIEKYDFIENEDFVLIKNDYKSAGRPTTDYIVTMDMAKELCMVSNTEKGKETRKYFIKIEKEASKGNFDKLLTSKQFNAEMSKLDLKLEKTNIKRLKLLLKRNKMLGAKFSMSEYVERLGREPTESERRFIDSLPSEQVMITGINKPHCTMKDIIVDNELQTTSQKANEVLIKLNLLSPKRTVTDKGELFGFDWRASQDSSYPRWYNDKSSDIVDLLVANGIKQL